MPNRESATDFLQVLNSVHPSLSFIMELEHEGSIPFLAGTFLTRCGSTLTTEVYRRPTDTVPLLHFQSHVDSRYKNTQCVVYLFQCDLDDASFVGFTARHLHQRISEHRCSAIEKHLGSQHGNNRTTIDHLFKVLRKYNSELIA